MSCVELPRLPDPGAAGGHGEEGGGGAGPAGGPLGAPDFRRLVGASKQIESGEILGAVCVCRQEFSKSPTFYAFYNYAGWCFGWDVV